MMLQQTGALAEFNIFILITFSIKLRTRMQLQGQNQESGKRVKHYSYNYADLIGRGNFSRVYKGLNTKTQEIVAIKIVSLDALKSQHLEQLVFDQIKILQQMNHPNVLKFHEALLSERNCYIVTDLCDGGNLEDRIGKNLPFSEGELSNIIFDVFQGLKYLRQMGVCHRDIKTANIFMSGGRAIIADFGLAKVYKQLFKDLDIGSPLYMSPEGLLQNVYGQKTDIWAFGIVIYEMLHGTTPFIGCKTEMELKTAVLHPLPEYKFRNCINPALRQLLNSLLTIDQFQRPSVYDLQQDTFIQSVVQGPESRPRRHSKTNGLKIIQTSKIPIKQYGLTGTEYQDRPGKKIQVVSHIELGVSKPCDIMKYPQEQVHQYKNNHHAHLQAKYSRSRHPATQIYAVNPLQSYADYNGNGKRVNSSKTIETNDSDEGFLRRKEGRLDVALIK